MYEILPYRRREEGARPYSRGGGYGIRGPRQLVMTRWISNGTLSISAIPGIITVEPHVGWLSTVFQIRSETGFHDIGNAHTPVSALASVPGE